MNVQSAIELSNARKFVHLLNDLKRRRTNAGISQTYMAEKIGTCFQSVNRWENEGFKTATVKHVLAYLTALEAEGVDISI